MRHFITIFGLLFGIVSMNAQNQEHNYEYQFFSPIQSGGGFDTPGNPTDNYSYKGKSVKAKDLVITLGKEGYEILNPLDIKERKELMFRKHIRADSKVYEAKLNDFMLKANNRIDSVAAAKANLAAANVRLQILDGLKSASLLDSMYRKSISETAVELFRVELKKSIEDLKTEIKK